MPDLQPCGTTAAYQRHKKRGETACQPCLDAQAAYQRQRYAALPKVRRVHNARTAARRRAMRRLASEHSARFRQLYLEEMRTAGGRS